MITRSYGLGVLLLVIALTSLGHVRPRWTAGTIALALLAWTSLAGAVLAGSLALASCGGGGRRAATAMRPRRDHVRS